MIKHVSKSYKGHIRNMPEYRQVVERDKTKYKRTCKHVKHSLREGLEQR